MATKIKPPNRYDKLVNEDLSPTIRTQRYFVEVTEFIENLEMPAITDISVSTTANNTNKINELLAALRTMGVLAT